VKSEAINELAAALAKAQDNFTKVRKDGANPHFKSRYASLEAYRDSTVGALSLNGLSVTQQISWAADRAVVVTTLLHSSGQWISSEMSMKPARDSAQEIGSVLSYIRRYSYSALLSISGGDEDDDGNAATGPTAPPPQPKPTPVTDNLYHANADDKRWLAAQCKAGGVTDKEHWTILSSLMEGKDKGDLADLIIKARKEMESM